jgi:hypothetical protein
MRRSLSIFLVLIFALGPLSTALEASDDARLPPCCRRHGAHHCAMSDAMIARMIETESTTPAFTAPSHCPYYPANLSAIMAPMHALAPSPASLPVLLAQAHSPSAARAAARVSPVRTHAGRSPPASI